MLSLGAKVLNGIKKPAVADFLISFFVAFSICLLTSTGLSPVYIGISASGMNADCNFFLYVAGLWKAGKTPYFDFFDNKGLYHLAVDVIGLTLGGRFGVWLLEILFVFATLYPLCFLIRRLYGNAWGYRALFYLLFFVCQAFVLSGNIEGEWILPFTSAFACFYVWGLLEKKDHDLYWGSFFMGLSVGLALNSRPVDGVFAAFGSLFCLVYALKHHRYAFLGINAGIAIFACLIPFAIFFPIAYRGGYLSEMVNAVYVQSFSYVGHNAQNSDILTLIDKLIAFLLAFLYWGFYLYQRKKGIGEEDLRLFFLLIGSLSNALIGLLMGYSHYLQAGFGWGCFGLLYDFESIQGKAHLSFKKASFPVLSVALVVYLSFFLGGYYLGGSYLPNSYYHTEEVAKDIALIKENAGDEEGAVFALDCDPAIYLQGEFVVNQRFLAYQYSMLLDNPGAKKEISAYLTSEGKPKWLLIHQGSTCFLTLKDEIAAAYSETPEFSNSVFVAYKAK